MNILTSQFFYTILVHDNFKDQRFSSQLNHLKEFLKPDLIISTAPIKGIETYNMTNLTSRRVLHNIYITNDNCDDVCSDFKYIKVTRDITHRFHTLNNTYLLIGVGKEYENFINLNRQWNGKHNKLPWITTYFHRPDISFVLLYINKQTYTLHCGIHCFESYFEPRSNNTTTENIFSNDFDFKSAKPDLSAISYK